MLGQFDFNVIERSFGYLFKEGMTFTLTLTALAMTGGIIFGTLLAMMRLSKFKALSMIAGAYVNLMRSVPLVLVIFWFYFLVPYIGAWIVGRSQPIQVGAFYSSVITFMLFEAAYYCEIMRAGIQSVSRGQVSAGYALGLNYWQTMGKIILPQAFRNMRTCTSMRARATPRGRFAMSCRRNSATALRWAAFTSGLWARTRAGASRSRSRPCNLPM